MSKFVLVCFIFYPTPHISSPSCQSSARGGGEEGGGGKGRGVFGSMARDSNRLRIRRMVKKCKLKFVVIFNFYGASHLISFSLVQRLWRKKEEKEADVWWWAESIQPLVNKEHE